MPLKVEGHPILSFPQFSELISCLREDETIEPLTAWFAGESVTPAEVYWALSVDAVACLKDGPEEQRGLELIQIAKAELERAFGERVDEL